MNKPRRQLGSRTENARAIGDEPMEIPALPPGAVIAATDLGDDSVVVIAQAHAWAKRIAAPLAICHAVPQHDAIMPLMPHLHRPIMDGVDRDAIVSRIDEQANALGIDDCAICLLSGSAHAAIVRLVIASPPQLLVIGATHRGTLEQLILGGTAEQLVRHAPCPVLVAREGAAGGPIIAATDLSDPALRAVQAAAGEARRRGSQLLVVHALDLPRQLVVAAIEPTAGLDAKTAAALKAAAEQVLAGILDRLEIAAEALVVEGRTARAIARAAGQRDASLIVVASHGQTGLEQIALGSSAAAIVRAAPCSVLVERFAPALSAP